MGRSLTGRTGSVQIISVLVVGVVGREKMLCFRRRLSAEGAKPESNNRWKSDLGHVCMWVGICNYGIYTTMVFVNCN